MTPSRSRASSSRQHDGHPAAVPDGPVIFKLSEAGPGSKHAPVWLALAPSMVIGALAQRSRLCMAGGIRDAVMFGDFKLLSGFLAIFLVALIGNLVTKQFHWGFQLQPIAHSSHVELLGMTLVGWGSVLLGGCPLRQLILPAAATAIPPSPCSRMLAGARRLPTTFGLAGTAGSTNAAGEFRPRRPVEHRQDRRCLRHRGLPGSFRSTFREIREKQEAK